MINDISIYSNFIDIVIDDSNRFDVSRKCLKYSECIKKLVGVHIFDQVTIDEMLKHNISDKSVCLELSIIFLKCASRYSDLELFSYISDEYYLPYVVFDVGNNYIVCSDYCYVEPFFNYLDRCFWNIDDISDIDIISSKYNLSVLDYLDYIDISNYFTITDILDEIELDNYSMISGSIAFDLAVSLGIKYVLINKKTNYKRLLDIVNYLDVC